MEGIGFKYIKIELKDSKDIIITFGETSDGPYKKFEKTDLDNKMVKSIANTILAILRNNNIFEK